MNLRDIIGEGSAREELEREELINLIAELKKYFKVEFLLDSQRVNTINDLRVNLDAKPNFTFSKMPVKLGKLDGWIRFHEGNITTIDGMPTDSQQIIFSNNQSNVSLVSRRPMQIDILKFYFAPHQTSLANSSNIRVNSIHLVECPALTSLAGLELFNTSFGTNSRVSVRFDPGANFKEDISKYNNCKFLLLGIEDPTFKIPLVKLIAFRGHENYADLDNFTVRSIIDIFPEVEPYFGKGARSIMPLVRYFSSINRHELIGDIT